MVDRFQAAVGDNRIDTVNFSELNQRFFAEFTAFGNDNDFIGDFGRLFFQTGQIQIGRYIQRKPGLSICRKLETPLTFLDTSFSGQARAGG